MDEIYRRIDWQWALNRGTTLSHGWIPEQGFIRYRWDEYAEHMGLYLLGIGAPQAYELIRKRLIEIQAARGAVGVTVLRDGRAVAINASPGR